jgi:hypothetical protein
MTIINDRKKRKWILNGRSVGGNISSVGRIANMHNAAPIKA